MRVEESDRTQQLPVVAAVDGSPESLAALAWAADHARRYGHRLRVVSAYAHPDVAGDASGSYAREAMAARGAARLRISRLIRPVIGPTYAEVVVAPGSIERLLIEQSREAAVIALGTRRTGSWSSWFRSSLTNRLTGRAACPVVSVPAAAVEPVLAA